MFCSIEHKHPHLNSADGKSEQAETKTGLNSYQSFADRYWYPWATPVLLFLWLMGMSARAQSIDLNGWNLRTEQSGTLRCNSNHWQQVELIWGSSSSWDGTYTAIRKDAKTIEIKAEPEFGDMRTWMLYFENEKAGTYTLDYALWEDFTIHEEGRFYNSQKSLWYADWAQMTGQTQNESTQVWEYLTGESAPKIGAEMKNGQWEIRVPSRISGREGMVELEESADLKNWRVCASPSQGVTNSQRYYRLKASLSKRPMMRPEAAVHKGTSTISAGNTARITGLATVNSLEITGNTGPTQIQITETRKPEATEQIRPLTGLIGIQGLETLTENPIEVRVNVSVPKDQFAMGFIFDRETGRFEGMPLKELGDDHVTVASRHFCEFIILGIPFAELPDEVDSGFRPGTDDWEFTNYGSYIAPKGHCAGQAISAMYYYVNQRQNGNGPKLFRMWDNPGNDWETPYVETDNERGYALASMVQKSINWDSFGNNFWWNLSPGDLNTYRSFVFSIWLTGEPQEVGIYRQGGGHAIIAWKCAYGSIHVADPNYPGNDTRWINFISTSNLFDPYYSGPTAADLGVAYPKILYFGKTTMIDWKTVGSLWEEAKAGTIANGVYPGIALKVYNKDMSLAGSITNSMAGGIETIQITGNTVGFGGSDWNTVTAYKPDGNGYTFNSGWIELEDDTNRIGLEIFKEITVGTNTKNSWVGFQWLNVICSPSNLVSVSILPLSVALNGGETNTFTATVTGASNTMVLWSIQEGAGGGTITSDGIYTAPNTAGTYHVIATSQSQPSAFATATITVSPPPTARFSRINISATPGITTGINCSGEGAYLSSELTIPILWSGSHFTVDGSKTTTNNYSVKTVTVSISGTVNSDKTISLSGTGTSKTVEKISYKNYTDTSETTTSITVDRVPRSPLFLDDIHWLGYRESDRSCLKGVSSVMKQTRQFTDGTSEVLKSCTMTDVDWANYGYVQVYGE